MLTNLKALVVVLALAWAVFYLARPLCLQFMTGEAFASRRNVWFALTVVAFASPTFWSYGLFALILLAWAGTQDKNPLALYVFVTFTVPNASFYIPAFLVNQFFDLTQYRILSLSVLVPAIFRGWEAKYEFRQQKMTPAEGLLLAFLVLQVVVQLPYESATAGMRRSFLLIIDIFVVFYAFSRLASRKQVSDVLASFWLACAVMAPIAIFESAKGWLLYTGLSSLWGDPNIFAYLWRGGGLRGQAASNHSINLGYLMAVSLGFFLYLRHRSSRPIFDWLVIVVLCGGSYASGSRAGWITSALVALVFVAVRPNAASKLIRAAVVGATIIGVMYVTPLKEAVIDRLPIIGTSDQDSIDYRQQLYDVSMQLIWQNPFFGDPFVTNNMESMRQGQGIIDIVNGYLFTALFQGLVGLSLQMGALLIALWLAAKATWFARSRDPDTALLGAGLLAVFIGSLFLIATVGFGPTTYVLGGLLCSYAKCTEHELASAGASSSCIPLRDIRSNVLA